MSENEGSGPMQLCLQVIQQHPTNTLTCARAVGWLASQGVLQMGHCEQAKLRQEAEHGCRRRRSVCVTNRSSPVSARKTPAGGWDQSMYSRHSQRCTAQGALPAPLSSSCRHIPMLLLHVIEVYALGTQRESASWIRSFLLL